MYRTLGDMWQYWKGKDRWFDQHWSDKIDFIFAQWWLDFYGPPEKYNTSDAEREEYFIRMAFAFQGWQAGAEQG